MKRIALCVVLLATACVTVREEDQASWAGQPVSALEKHPVFLTMQLVRTRTSDGTEIVELRERAQYYQLLQGWLDLCGLN